MEKFEVLEKRYDPLKKKNIWKIKYSDRTEVQEFPMFIDRCLLCGDWINKGKVNKCSFTGKKECCNVCLQKCRDKGVCLLK